jgi:heat shock protein HspQ
MNTSRAKFAVGQVIHHRLFGYRGVIIDVDPYFKGPVEWYRAVAPSRPRKDRPWYHVLVDGSPYRTYVAERNLESDETGAAVRHPDLALHFRGRSGVLYLPRRKGS